MRLRTSVVAVLLVALVGGLVAITVGVSHFVGVVVLPGSTVERLRGPAAVVAPGDGFVHGRATLRPAVAGGLLPCLVRWRSGKHDREVTVHDELLVALEGGPVLRLAADVELPSIDGATPTGRAATGDAARASALARTGDREARVTCVRPDERVYVQGCVPVPGQLAPCPGDDGVAVAIAPTVQPLVDGRVAGGVLGLAAALVGLLVVTGAGIYASSLPGVLLAKLSDRPAVADATVLAALLGFGLAFAMTLGGVIAAALGATEGAYVLGAGAIVALVTCLAGARPEWRALGAALETLRSTPTTRLYDAVDGVRELALRVALDAPLVASATGLRSAFELAVITEKVRSGKSTTTRTVATVHVGDRLPVEDASGRGVLEMDGSDVVVLRAPTALTPEAIERGPAWIAEAIAAHPRAPEHQRFEVACSALAPGEALLVRGCVELERPPDAQVSYVGAGYRGAASIAVVRGEPLVVAGDEAQILQALRRSRLLLALVGVVVVPAIGAAVVALAFAASR